MKTCTKCNIEQELDQFRTYQNKRKDKTYYRNKCKSCSYTNEKQWREQYNNKENNRKRMRNNQLVRTYGITQEDYDTMFESQLGLCAICSKSEKRALSVDHCHNTGVVRKLLCSDCNFGLGKFKDDIELLAKAIDYLKLYQA